MTMTGNIPCFGWIDFRLLGSPVIGGGPPCNCSLRSMWLTEAPLHDLWAFFCSTHRPTECSSSSLERSRLSQLVYL